MKKLALAGLALFLMAAPATAGNPKIEEIVSPGGIKAWLVESKQLPLISVHFAFRGGVEQDPKDKQGLATLTTSLLTQGAGPYDAAAFQEKLAAHSISLGFDAGRDALAGEMKMLRRDKDEAFRLLSLALTQPRFEAADFSRLLEQQKTAARARLASPEWQARYALFQDIYGPDHPYGFRSLGSATSLAQITRDDVQTFAKMHLAKDNLIIGVVGDISRTELASALDRVFGALPARAAPDSVPQVQWPAKPTQLRLEREGAQTALLLAAPMMRRNDPDWYAAEIANYILGGGGFASRLMTQVREEKGLTYGISTALAPMDKDSMILASFSADNAKAGEALALTRKVWQDFYARGVAQDEIDGAVSYLTGVQPLGLTSTDAIAGKLVGIQLEKLGRDYLDQRQAKLRAVRADDVARVIKKWFDPAHLAVAAIGKPQGLSIENVKESVKE